MLLKTILITAFGIIASLGLISDNYNKKLLGYFTKPLLIPLLGIFYYLTANKIDLFIISALLMSFISSILILIKKPRTNNMAMMFMSLFYLLFSLAVLKTNYFLIYVPIWFYIYLILLIIVFSFFYKKISSKLNKNTKLTALSFLLSNTILFFIILCRAWRFRSLLLSLPIIGIVLITLFSLLFIFNNYNKEIKNGNLFLTASNIYGHLFLVMGVIADW